MITRDSLIKVMPGVPKSLASTYAKYLNESMLQGNITTKSRASAFLAQVGHESGDLQFMEELASGAEYEGRHDLGNIHKGDGPRYKGRGPIQLTGRANYELCGHEIGVDLVNHPERAAEPEYAFRIAVWFWTRNKINIPADRDDMLTVTKIINGGTNGLQSRLDRWRHIRTLPTRSYLPGTVLQRLRRKSR